MKRSLAAGLAAVLLLGTAGCGDPGEAYCDALRADQSRLGDMVNSGRVDALLSGLPLLEELSDQAPDELSDEWQTFLNAVERLDDAVKAAGLSRDDLEDGLPDSLKGQDRKDVAAAATRLASDDVIAAATGIETQARDVCKVNIGV